MAVGAAGAPRVSAVVVSFNTRQQLLRCLTALREHSRLPLETIVVDNASRDGSAAAVREAFPETRLIENAENRGFSRANNQALRQARAPYVLILNSDAEVRPGCVEALCVALDTRAETALVGPRTLSADGAPQLSFGRDLTPWSEWRQRRLVRGLRRREAWALAQAEARTRIEQQPDWVSASCLLVRRRALEAVGGFDEDFFLYEEDVDLCLRLRRAGWQLLFQPAAEVIHHLGRSMDQDPERAAFEYQRSHLLYYRKHNGPLWHALLRLRVAAHGLSAWLAALGPGETRRTRRQACRRLLSLVRTGR